jgi:hypothetical protein
MTTALKTSRWYRQLYTYKLSTPPRYIPRLSNLADGYFAQHKKKISKLLGGKPTVLTLVPSKRGIPFRHQPLREALSVCGRDLVRTLQFLPGAQYKRQGYFPGSFQAMRDFEGERIVLFEDTWVTGATALSSAGALLEAGAESVIVLALARCIDGGFWPEDHPYLKAMKKPWKVEDWPR